jgi:hypothetical protein
MLAPAMHPTDTLWINNVDRCFAELTETRVAARRRGFDQEPMRPIKGVD